MVSHHHPSFLVPLLLIALSSMSNNAVFAARHLLEITLPKVPELPKPEFPPLPTIPTLPKPELPPLPKAELPPLPHLLTIPKPELPSLPKTELPPVPHVPTFPKLDVPTLPQPELPTLPKPEVPKLPELPSLPHLPDLSMPKLPTIPTLPKDITIPSLFPPHSTTNKDSENSNFNIVIQVDEIVGNQNVVTVMISDGVESVDVATELGLVVGGGGERKGIDGNVKVMVKSEGKIRIGGSVAYGIAGMVGS
ncbi:hypothetical protein HHK36_030737 [Tetracentron sinense]|uniref:Uncharacterized protein n=1 Tax=Tetracentron sinense TaxID=13715 RepID=A0A834YBL9_TETSI|nr:hypothetical protein HHK36_030737 [Tetracentron sinense]